VGCIFKAIPVDFSNLSKGYVPPSCIVIRDGERHLQNRGNSAYVDRHQIVPISGPNIEFYENRAEQGISRGKVNPQNYKVDIDKDGGKMPRGPDEWDDRKRDKIVLWKKFANYMTAYGRDQDYPSDDTVARSCPEHKSVVAVGNVVTFYQRFGDVGCWGFCDGRFQVCIPYIYIAQAMLTLSSSTSRITLRLLYLQTALGVISSISHSKLHATLLSKALFLQQLLMIVSISPIHYKHFSTS
jgi:hypothetical protein